MTLTEINRSLSNTGSDKGDSEHTFAGRSYLDVYEPLFLPLREQNFDLIEIGVSYGGSMRLWKQAFPKARIHGIDINPECKGAEQDGAIIHIGSQADKEFVESIATTCSDLRIIIDDGSHLLAHILSTFSVLWPRLAPHGFYIIEDVSTTYWGVDSGWRGMKLNKELPVIPREILNHVILGRIHDMDHGKGDVASLYFTRNLIIFEKV